MGNTFGVLALLLGDLLDDLFLSLFWLCLHGRLGTQCGELLENRFELQSGIAEPVHRPDAANAPAELLQHALA
ncbi:hypothetical protein D9M70_601710 [compost metagenome]